MERRLFRITWNENNWEFPSGHKWKSNNQGKKGIAYENQFGFGHEEWMFNTRYRKDGYQYGYIRGLSDININIETIDIAYLFSIDPISKTRFLIGEINDLEIIQGWPEEEEKALQLINKYLPDAVNELKGVKADHNELWQNGQALNCKFKISDYEVYDPPIKNDYLNQPRFNRFKPFIIDDDLLDNIQNCVAEAKAFIFKPGFRKQSGSSTGNRIGTKYTIKRTHDEISKDLYTFFKALGIKEECISIDKTRVGNKLVDAVIEEEKGFRLFEIKTSSSGYGNIREAMGQLIEYALMDPKSRITELNIVGPAILNNDEKDYLSRIKELIALPLMYWAYDGSQDEPKKRFVKH